MNATLKSVVFVCLTIIASGCGSSNDDTDNAQDQEAMADQSNEASNPPVLDEGGSDSNTADIATTNPDDDSAELDNGADIGAESVDGTEEVGNESAGGTDPLIGQDISSTILNVGRVGIGNFISASFSALPSPINTTELIENPQSNECEILPPAAGGPGPLPASEVARNISSGEVITLTDSTGTVGSILRAPDGAGGFRYDGVDSDDILGSVTMDIPGDEFPSFSVPLPSMVSDLTVQAFGEAGMVTWNTSDDSEDYVSILYIDTFNPSLQSILCLVTDTGRFSPPDSLLPLLDQLGSEAVTSIAFKKARYFLNEDSLLIVVRTASIQ